MPEKLPTFFTLQEHGVWPMLRPTPPWPAWSSDPPYSPCPPEWLRARVGSVPFGYAIVGGEENDKPVRWDRSVLDVLSIHGEPRTMSGQCSDTMLALFDVLPAGTRPPLPLVAGVAETLAAGLSDLRREVVTPLSTLLPPAYYLVSLSVLRPQLVDPGSALDYRTNDLPRFWPHETAEATSSSYYRTPGWHEPATITYVGGHQVPGVDVGVNVLLPTQAPEALNPDRVQHYRAALEAGARPTVVTLHEFRYRNSNSQHGATERLADLWLSIHHVLDGHHKLHAAAGAGAPISVLAFTQLPWVAGSHLRPWVQGQQDALTRFAEVSAQPPP